MIAMDQVRRGLSLHPRQHFCYGTSVAVLKSLITNLRVYAKQFVKTFVESTSFILKCISEIFISHWAMGF